MRIGEEIRGKVIELDRRYRSTWDARAIAHVIGISATTAAKILREVRGPRPKRSKQPHTRRTHFIRRDVMWSSDFVRLGWGWMLIKTMDEMSGYRLGWDLCRSETAEAALKHARSIVERIGRAPLVWKYDHGVAFTSDAFQDFLEDYRIVPYPIPPRAPWANGRVERDHQEILNWLIAFKGKDLADEALEREVDEGMWMLNFVKPRATLQFRKSAEVYFSQDAELDAADEVREWLEQGIMEARCELGSMDCEAVELGNKSWERLHRRAVRTALQKLRLYEEWDEEALEMPRDAKIVNRSDPSDVSF